MSDVGQSTDRDGVPAGPQMNLSLVPQESRFVVRLPVRIPRTGSLPIQLALPRLFHHRLRVGTSGSLNHALIALVRQAFAWLDADRMSLRIHAAHDPLTAPSPGGTAAQSDARDATLEEPANWQLPHPVFVSFPRDAQVLVEVQGRPSRQDIVYIQVGLPADIHNRLQEQGLGSISQLVAYLSRYAYMRLQTERLSLHVTVTDQGPRAPLQLKTPRRMPSLQSMPIVPRPIATVGELIEHLRKFPVDTPVGLADTGLAVDAEIIGLSIGRAADPTGTVRLVGESRDGIDGWIEEDG